MKNTFGFLFLALALNVHADPGTLNQNGLYEGVTLDRSGCQVKVSHVKTTYFKNWLKSASISSSIIANNEVVQIKCEDSIENGYSCVGKTKDNVLVILQPHNVDYGNGKIKHGNLIVSGPNNKLKSCSDLILTR